MNNRRTFFTLLAGVVTAGRAIAQRTTETRETAFRVSSRGYTGTPKIDRPENNECPVCGVFAPPFTDLAHTNLGITPLGPDAQPYVAVAATYVPTPTVPQPIAPKRPTQLVECAYCANAFFQEKEL